MITRVGLTVLMLKDRLLIEFSSAYFFTFFSRNMRNLFLLNYNFIWIRIGLHFSEVTFFFLAISQLYSCKIRPLFISLFYYDFFFFFVKLTSCKKSNFVHVELRICYPNHSFSFMYLKKNQIEWFLLAFWQKLQCRHQVHCRKSRTESVLRGWTSVTMGDFEGRRKLVVSAELLRRRWQFTAAFLTGIKAKSSTLNPCDAHTMSVNWQDLSALALEKVCYE